ncbi:MAG: membrane protein insertion efficiency factor YidD [Chlamydiae bacterium]|nr:membrane protein insertion efficiency factor YidD [Chlamydiota bacterium]
MRLFLISFIFILTNLSASVTFIEPWGKDFDLKPKTKNELEEKKNPSILTKLANAVIVFHQQVISPADGPRSSFRPTSSRYMQLAIERYGFVKGYLMGCDRLLRENDEKWVYQTVNVDNHEYKFDPALTDKHVR